MNEPAFTLYRSIFDAGRGLTRRSQGALLLALAEFYFEGREPQRLPRDAAFVFAGVRHRIERARSTAISKGSLSAGESGSGKSEPNAYATDTEPLREEYAAATGPVQRTYSGVTESVKAAVDEHGIGALPAETLAAHPDVHADVHADSTGTGTSTSMGMGSKEQGAAIPAAQQIEPAEDLEQAIEVVGDYILDRDLDSSVTAAALEWATEWHGKGWRDTHGCDMSAEIHDGSGELRPRWQVMLDGFIDSIASKSQRAWDCDTDTQEQGHPTQCRECGEVAYYQLTDRGTTTNCPHCGAHYSTPRGRVR